MVSKFSTLLRYSLTQFHNFEKFAFLEFPQRFACGYVHFSLELILLYYGTCAVIDQQWAAAHQHEDKDTYGRCQRIVIPVYRQLVKPGHKKIGLARLIVVQREGAAAGQQINDIEIIEIGHKGGYGRGGSAK